MVVKANQPQLLEDLETLFADLALVAATGTTAAVVNGGHGRIETRRLWTSTALVGYTDWPGLAQALCQDRTTTDKRTGWQRQERAYAVTSVGPERADAQALLALWREHWAIENRLHWVRDMTLHEDASRVRTGAAPQVMAALRNAVLTRLRAQGAHAIAAARRHLGSHPEAALRLVGIT